MKEKFIDVEKIIGDKNPTLLKRMPGFIINYLKKILHQEEVNDFLFTHGNLYNYEFCHQVVKEFNLTVNTFNIENIPVTGGAIFAVNHPLGGMDAMTIVHAFAEIRPDVKFIVNDILLNLENLKGLFVGVNKHGRTANKSLQQVNELFGSDQAVFVFPAGLVSRKRGGKVEDLEWKKTFITQAKRHNKPVIPVYLKGELSNFFYRLSNLRTTLGIKANIEMLYLVNELFKQRNKTIDIVFGKAIPAEHFDTTKKDQEWAQWVKDEVYRLSKNYN